MLILMEEFNMRQGLQISKKLGLLGLGLLTAYQLGCDGKAKDLAKGSNLGDAVIGDGGGGTRTDGNDFGQIYAVTTVVEASQGIAAWAPTDFPFTGPVRSFGDTTQNSQWPFEFIYNYPPNNYQLSAAHISFVARRDDSDTEGIFVDGVFSGRPPATDIRNSPKILHPRHACPGGCSSGPTPVTPSNLYVMDYSLKHYKIGADNLFDLNVADLLAPTTVTVLDAINDGHLHVVTGDDLAVRAGGTLSSNPQLFLDGFTVSKTALNCSPSPTYRFMNTYIHDDSNSIGQPAFSGTVYNPYTSWGTMGAAGNTVEFHFDQKLPRVSHLNDLTLNSASLSMWLQRAPTGPSAIVINGIGIAEAGFNRSLATSAVESWDDTAGTQAAFASFLSAVPTSGTATVSLNLINLLGSTRLKSLLAQGKLNIAVSGALAKIQGSRLTSQRTYGTAANGPELYLQGQYTIPICQIPNDPNSPLNDSTPVGGSCSLDQSSPVVSSIQAANITANSASIQWLSNEPSDSQVAYGLTGPTALTTLATANVSFHSVQLTGLQPYKYYQYTVKSKDACGNETTSSIKTFRTLR